MLNHPELLGKSFITSTEIGNRINKYLSVGNHLDVYTPAQNKNLEDGLLYLNGVQKTVEFKQRQNHIFTETIKVGDGEFGYIDRDNNWHMLPDIQIPGSNIKFLRDIYMIYDLDMRYVQMFSCKHAVSTKKEIESGRGYFTAAFVPLIHSFIWDSTTNEIYMYGLNHKYNWTDKFTLEELLDKFF